MAGPLCLQSLFQAATIDQGTHSVRQVEDFNRPSSQQTDSGDSTQRFCDVDS